MFSLISVANVKSDLSSFLIADHPGDHLTAWTHNSYVEADITKSIQKKKIQKESYWYHGYLCQAMRLSGWRYRFSPRTTGTENMIHWVKIRRKHSQPNQLREQSSCEQSPETSLSKLAMPASDLSFAFLSFATYLCWIIKGNFHWA